MVTSSAETASSSTITSGRGGGRGGGGGGGGGGGAPPARGRGGGGGDALALAAGHPQRERGQDIRVEADLLQQLEHTRAPLVGRREPLRPEGVEQDALHIPARIERAQRVLIHHGDAAAETA